MLTYLQITVLELKLAEHRAADVDGSQGVLENALGKLAAMPVIGTRIGRKLPLRGHCVPSLPMFIIGKRREKRKVHSCPSSAPPEREREKKREKLRCLPCRRCGIVFRSFRDSLVPEQPADATHHLTMVHEEAFVVFPFRLRGKLMRNRSASYSAVRITILAFWLLATVGVFPLSLTGQQSKAPVASVQSLSGYVIQGAVNDECLQYLLQDTVPSKDQNSRLMQALADQNAAWSALLDRLRGWKPTSKDLQAQAPQRLFQLISVAQNSLAQSVGTIKKSPQYEWLSGRLVSSLAKVDTLQSRLKEVLTPKPSEKRKR
jgi:hypothetical protein